MSAGLADIDAVQHRPVRRWLRRRCVCGLRWPCLDRRPPAPALTSPSPEVPQWARGRTEVLPQRGWINEQTPAQAWRGNGGRGRDDRQRPPGR
ncbi:hypothetical protein [Actinoplanes sp. NPDC051859]|uniref:hypothetical protein n=1 Tax=Actinoplanes sp. NPDC051859 TaxID=3363909 RepID=UPI00378EE561